MNASDSIPLGVIAFVVLIYFAWQIGVVRVILIAICGTIVGFVALLASIGGDILAAVETALSAFT